MNSISKLIPLFFALIFLSACAKQNAGIVKQTYHDLTSHYNGYFNANEAFNNQIKSLEDGNKDNYEEILPLNNYGSYEEVISKNEGLSASIGKARLSIQTHQEKQDGKNYRANDDNSISNWSDDAFLLIGKGYFFQGKLDSSINCFRYITANFDEAVDGRSKDKIKKQKSSKKKKAKDKKKKEKLIEKELDGKDIRPHKKIGLHESVKSEALVWLANAYVSNKQFIEAEAILTYIRGDKTFLKNYDKDVELSNAYLYLTQESYQTGLPFLERTIAQTKKQKQRTRLQFIAAQINEHLGQKELAASYYEQSMKGNPNFEMIFYAKLKLIQMNRQTPGQEKEALKLIAKMTKDNKNREYFDQLYYEKALIALNNNEREDAKKYLLKSTAVSLSNQKQKGISFGKLGDINYDEENYTLAQAYYDSSLNFIDNSYVRYETISTRSTVLTDLIDYLSTIRVNDSLLILAEIPAKELEAMLYEQAVDIIDAEIKQENKNKQSELFASSATSTNGSKNGWYFYSDASRNSGYKKFKQTWGDITLEDNWRRSDKNSEFNADDTEEDGSGQDQYFARIDSKYEEMIASIPSTDKEKKDLKKDIIAAYYNSAVIYKIGLDNLPKSTEMFVSLNSRFAENRYEPEALYQLYVLYTDLDEPKKAEAAKKELLSKYPNNKFSDYLLNPNSTKDKDFKAQAEDFYEGAYDLYLNENYDAVILKCEEANERFSRIPLIAKFDLLKAMAIGGKKLFDPFVASLEYVVNKHKDTEEQARAEELLAYLNGTAEKEAEENAAKENAIDNKIDPQNPRSNQSLIQKDDQPAKEVGGVKLNLGNKQVQIGGKKGATKVELEEE